MGRAAAHHQEGHYPLPDGEGDRALDSAMTSREARPHLVKSYKGMQSPAFNGYVYVYRGKGCKELQWARKRGIDLRGFTLSYDGDVRSGYVLWMLMGGSSKDDLNLDVAKYYATRGKLTRLDEVFREWYGHTALTMACEKDEGVLDTS